MSEDAPVAIVTGGASGLGASICVALLKQEYKICVADIQETSGKQFVEEQKAVFGSENVTFSCCDVSKESDYARTFDLALNAFQKVDVLVNNAGIVSEKEPQKALNVNLMGPIIGCQMALKYMGKSNGGKGGMVINTSSILGFLPFSAAPVYAASKHGVLGLTRSYGLPYYEQKEGVIFAALCPSFTDTNLLRTIGENSLNHNLDYSKHPHLMSPDYVAQGVVKLLEDRINGSALVVRMSKGYHYVGYQQEFDETPLL